MGSEWGQLLFGKTLVRSLAQPLWRVCGVTPSLSIHQSYMSALNQSCAPHAVITCILALEYA